VSELSSIAVLGGDARAVALARDCARSGRHVTIFAVGRELTREDLGADAGPIQVAQTLENLAGASIVIELGPADSLGPPDLLRQVSELSADAVLAIGDPLRSVTEMGATVTDPGRLAGLHLVDLGQPGGLAEVVRGLRTRQQAIDTLAAFADSLGRQTVEVRDRPGQLVHRLLVPYLNDVIQAYDDGLASARDIDLALELGLGYPTGPLALLDRLGLDGYRQTAIALHTASGDIRYSPPPLLTRMVQAGMGFRAEEGDDR
jgi:3-hydroxybutyryl-CoA dehydrogenase